jgi:hypothetical protein
MNDRPADELLTVKEYAALFRRHPQTIYRAIYCARLRYPVERPTGGNLLIRVPSALVERLRARAA